MRRVLCLFAKAPVAGRVKTRLVPPLSPDQAARLYEAMLLDTAEQHATEKSADLALWYAPDDALSWFQRAVPAAYRLIAQSGDPLGERMAAAFRLHCGEGYTRVLLRGTDSPSLPGERIAEAFAALERVDLVVCPDLDGGYNMIGLRRPSDALFAVEMSRGDVLGRTLERAERLGLRHHCLAPHHDVDTGRDLERLRASLGAAEAPRTAAWLRANAPQAGGIP